jgi:hypothetical protein
VRGQPVLLDHLLRSHAPRIAGLYAFFSTVGGVNVNVQPVETVLAGSAAMLAVAAPASAVPGVPFTVTVTAEDVWGNTATSYLGTVGFLSTDPKATLPGNYTFVSADKGQHGFAGVVLQTAGTQTLTATDTTTSSITGSASISVHAAAAAQFVVGAPATATAGTAFSFTVTAEDPFGNTAAGYSGTVHFTSSDGSAVLPADATLTNGTGTFSATLQTAGTQTLTATDTTTSSITGSASISVQSGPCNGQPYIVHSNGLGQTFSDCVALGTYNITQATEAALAWDPSGSVVLAQCLVSHDFVVYITNGGETAAWDYYGTYAGHVALTQGTTPVCPTSADPVWD